MLVEREAIGHAGDVVGDKARRRRLARLRRLGAPFGRQAVRLGEIEFE